jgi:hypothetical protein
MDFPETSILLISASHVAWVDRHMPLYPAIGEPQKLSAWAGLELQFSSSQPTKQLG